jgi:hypothetical protein
MSIDVYVQTGWTVQVTPQVSPEYIIGNIPVLVGSGNVGATQAWVDSGYYPRNNPSGYATGIDGSLFVRKTESGIFYTIDNPSGFITGIDTSSFVLKADTGVFITASQTGQFVTAGTTGSFITSSQTGQFVVTGNTGIFITSYQTGNFITTSQTGQFIVTSQTGQFVTTSQTGHIHSQYALSAGTGQFVDSSKTGQFIDSSKTGQFLDTSDTGWFVTTGSTGVFVTIYQTGQFAPSGMTGQFITTAQTGQFAPAGLTGQFITTAQTGHIHAQYALSAGTGQFITTAQTGGFYPSTNPNNYITSSQVSGVFGINVTGQVISGIVVITGIGGTVVDISGNAVRISGGSSINTGGFVTTGQTGVLLARGETGIFYPASNPNNYITAAQAGGVSSISVTGQAISGVVYFTGVGGTVVSISGLSVVISGGSSVNTGSFITTGQTGNFVTINQTGVLAEKYLGLPTDGAYGGANGAIAGVQAGDRHEDALDKIEVVLGKLAPSKPLNLSSATFALSGASYSAYMQGTNTQYSNVVNRLMFTGYSTGFYDADNGILSGYINGILTGVRTLSTGSDIGTYSGLKITNDFDYWAGSPGKAGFWNCLNAQVSPTTTMNTGFFSVRMGHSTTGPTAVLSGFCDAPLTPSSVWTSSGTGACTFRWIDGIISFATSDVVYTKFNVSNAVCAFYANPIAQLTCSQLSTTNIAPTGTPMSGATLTLSGNQTVNTSAYITGASITLTTYNSAGGTNSYATPTNFRIDTVSSQPAQRRGAGTGRFPTTNYNLAYNNNLSLDGTEELQLINGLLQHPPKVNYGAFIPSGLNYMNIQTGGYSGCRWGMFDMGSISNASNIQVTFNTTTNFGASAVIADFLLYARVSGGTNGWINGNTAYGGVGNPTNNDDPALVVGSSTATVKVITFGTAALTGPVYIRVGLPSGSNKTFASISMVTV